ncbi:MAG: hypothetical protein ACE5JM_11485 [Armatimonadota bacterium]
MSDNYPSMCILPNPPRFERGKWRDIDALCANLAYLGKTVDSAAVESAAAASSLFDFQYSERWSDDAAASACSGDVLREACEAMGYSASWLVPDSFEEAWDAIRGRIVAGQPVIAGGIVPGKHRETCRCAHYSLVVGYDDEGDAPQVAVVGWEPGGAVTWTKLPSLRGEANNWHARVRSLAVAPDVWASRPLLMLNGQIGEPRADTPDLARDNLRRCVEYATSESGPVGHWRLWPGIRGMKAWGRDVADYEAAMEREPPEERGFPLTNISLGLSHCLEQRRGAFARHLRDIRHLFPRDVKTRLAEAAGHCEKQAALMASFRELLFGAYGTWAEQQELGQQRLCDVAVRASAFAVLCQVVGEEQALVEALASAADGG